jgi:hypothetical protein
MKPLSLSLSLSLSHVTHIVDTLLAAGGVIDRFENGGHRRGALAPLEERSAETGRA